MLTCRWFHNGTELDTSNLEGMPDQDDKDQRCIQVGDNKNICAMRGKEEGRRKRF